MKMPTLLTLSRIGAIPIVLMLYFLPFEWSHLASASLFILCAITDWLDGYLARKWGIETALGAFLDPVADKLLVVSVILALVYGASSLMFLLPSIVIVSREMTVLALREWMSSLGKRASVRVTFIAKLKTACQLFALSLLLFYTSELPAWIWNTGLFFFYVASVLTVWSGINYLKIAWPDLTAGSKE